MRTAHLGTFDAERWWRPGDLGELPAAAATAATDTMDELLAGFCAPGDLLITRRALDPGLVAGLAACGVSFDHHAVGGDGTIERLVSRDERALALLAGCERFEPYAVLPDTARLDRGGALPSADVVATVNSKTWSNELVTRLGLPGAARVVRSVDELTDAVDGVVVVKDPYGVSGRAMLEVGTPGVLRAVTRTLARQDKRVELLVQPKFDKSCDFSGHIELARDGSWEFLGVQAMTNKGFRHIGSEPASPRLLATVDGHGYRQVLGEVAAALAAAGYWGPVGVDSMVLRDGGIVPILEINARQSLGLLPLRLGNRVPGCALWQVEVSVPPGSGIGDVLTAWKLLRYNGNGAGAVVLSGSGLAAPGGRVYCALIGDPDERAALRDELPTALAAVGLAPRGVAHVA